MCRSYCLCFLQRSLYKAIFFRNEDAQKTDLENELEFRKKIFESSSDSDMIKQLRLVQSTTCRHAGKGEVDNS